MKQELEALSSINFKFIVDFHKTFKDSYYIYFLTELVSGFELYDLLVFRKNLKDEEIKFISAVLVLCLEYLHGIGIIHRDLKPENIMIDNMVTLIISYRDFLRL